MNVAIASMGCDLDSEVNPRFGRAAYILIVDTVSLSVDVIDNSGNKSAVKDAGIQTARMLCNKGIKALLTGYCGSNAFDILNAAGIKVANNVNGSVRQAVHAFKEAKLSFANSPNTEGHWQLNNYKEGSNCSSTN